MVLHRLRDIIACSISRGIVLMGFFPIERVLVADDQNKISRDD